MSRGDSWADREKALEESFFYQRNRELLAKLKDRLGTDEQKKALSEACGITDDAVLDHLVAINIGRETLAALSLVPLVAVAWADGEMKEKERQAILAASEAEGIGPGSVCYQLLESWLIEAPGDELASAWKDYIGGIAPKITPDGVAALKSEVMGRAKKVARAAGGILGVHRISHAEREMLNELEAAFPS